MLNIGKNSLNPLLISGGKESGRGEAGRSILTTHSNIVDVAFCEKKLTAFSRCEYSSGTYRDKDFVEF